MDIVNVPIEKANEPKEEARQPDLVENQMSTSLNKAGQHSVTFAESTATTVPQNNSAYKNVLSQPPNELSHKQKMLWLQKRRTAGLWVQCDDCTNWRYLSQVLDSHELPAKWYCWMNPDSSLASCSVPEVPINLHDEEDLIHAEYAAGSVVLARMPGFPWWPAMVDDCPDTEQYYWLDGFSDIPTHYNVVFFDALDVTRAWIAPENMLPYKDNKKTLRKSLNIGKYKKRINEAMAQANDAEKLTLAGRLSKYSFITRYHGKILTPRKINKNIVRKYQNKIKRKFQVDIGTESTDTDDEIDIQAEKKKINKKNVIKKGIARITNPNESDITLTDLTNNNTRNLNSLTVQKDSESGPVENGLSEVSNCHSNREQETENINDSTIVETFQTEENSDDFDF